MFLEILTFLMLVLVIGLKYGAVTRIVKLRHRLRDAETRCRRNEERLKLQRSERRIAEREESNLIRQQIALEGEAKRVEEDLNNVKEANMEVLQQLSKTKGAGDLTEG